MKKKILILLILTIYLTLISAGELETKIFDSIENSVVCVDASFYLDKKDFSNIDIIKKLEEKYNKKILDSYAQIQTGSGMFITKNGYVLTNHHVIDVIDIDVSKAQVYNGIIFNFLSTIPEDILSLKDYRLVKNDIKKAIDNSKVHYRIMVNNKNYYECEIINSDKDIDIALLKINTNIIFKPILMGDSEQLKVGRLVIAIGYPLTGVFFELFKENFKSTMTSGTISAIRDENWGIQHTAPTNHGNSGGPLLNKNGELIGINVGTISNANGLFFSIPIKKVKEWLNSIKYSELIQKNNIDSKGLNLYKDLVADYIDSSNNILVKLDEGYKVYTNGTYKGKTPLYLENMPQGIVTIRVESDLEYSEQRFNINKESDEIYNYKPTLNKYYGKLFINSNPIGAKVILDDMEIDKTPCALNDVVVGKHKIILILEGYNTVEKEITINKTDTLKVIEKLVKATKLSFKNKLPKDTKIEIKKGDDIYNFKFNDTIYLKPDKYELNISSCCFDTQKINVDLTDSKDLELDLNVTTLKSKLFLKHLKKESKIFIDNEDVTDQITGESIFFNIGKYQLKIITKNYKDILKDIELEKNRNLTITLIYQSDK